MHVDHTTDEKESTMKKLIGAHDSLPWWFFGIVAAVGIALLVYSIL